MKHFFSKLFGTVNERKLKEMQPRVDVINSLESEFKKLTDQELKNIDSEIKSLVTNASEFALESKLPDDNELLTDMPVDNEDLGESTDA